MERTEEFMNSIDMLINFFFFFWRAAAADGFCVHSGTLIEM